MFARKSGGNYVKLKAPPQAKCLHNLFGTSTDLLKGKTKFFAELIHALENSGLKGAEILQSSNTIPNFYILKTRWLHFDKTTGASDIEPTLLKPPQYVH